jgi:hypothetical protein
MKLYTKEEKRALWNDDPLNYVIMAHEQLCCELPERDLCLKCELRHCHYYHHALNLYENGIYVAE